MFEQGEYIIYSIHGVCLIDEIKEKVVDKATQLYYVLRPFNQPNSRIMTPINNDKVRMRPVMDPEEAQEIMATFSCEDAPRILDNKQRDQHYTKIIKEGDPKDLVDVINALVIETRERELDKKKLSATDMKHLDKAKQLLYAELAVSLDIEMEEIEERIDDIFEMAETEFLELEIN